MITRVKVTNYRCFSSLDFEPNDGMNVIVGDNEAGKSTLLEVISLVISGRVRGRSISEDLNPFWFNQSVVEQYFNSRQSGAEEARLPEIDLEVYFSDDTPGVERLKGIHNSMELDCPGLRVTVKPDPELRLELDSYLASGEAPRLIPTDLFTVNWRDFSGLVVTRSPRSMGIALIDGDTASSSTGIDYKLRQLLRDFVTRDESIKIALEHRKSKSEITAGTLSSVNRRIDNEGNSFGVGLQMDQSAATNWDAAVVPHINSIPFSMLGHGRKVATKVALAMSRTSESTQIVLVEEPENHMSHTQLQKLIGHIQSLAGERQLFISTHSSFVLNRLGFDNLHILHEASLTRLNVNSISADTISYFRKQPGYDTLRLAIATKVVVVEGPSDEMIFNLAYSQLKGREPREDAIDVITLGTRGRRALELGFALGKQMAVLRDNDGRAPEHWKDKVSEFLEDGVRELFVSDIESGNTLEPQMINAGNEAVLRSILEVSDNEELIDYMMEHKTDWAWRVAEASPSLQWPAYIQRAIEFYDGD
ncbi:MAG: AAA family ATPase [Thermomicrobiales bacterium]|nr:AAA family ATPase [Thermomicrobiales bacterium]MCO5228057.1 AAA family ATPase [Thermomicrobiales bacterium]